MLNLFRAELFKLQKSLSIKICFLLSCISAGALVFISHGITVGTFSKDISGNASGLTEIVIVSLLGSLMTGIIICGDFESKTIHNSVTGGNGRITIILSKVLVYVLVMAVLLLPYMVAVLIGVLTGAGFNTPYLPSEFIQLLTVASGRDTTAGLILKIIMITLVIILVNAARLSICIPIAFKIRKPVVVLAIGFTFNAVIDLLVGLVKDIPLIKVLISFTPYSRNFLFLTLDTTAATLLKAAICSIIFIGFIAALTYAIFRKADIK